jgi:CelD/BcsL family acetyltransferase involved in cellulose biosynthesis
MKNLEISVIDNFQDWSALTTQWERLVQDSAEATFFQTWQWLMSWAECCLGHKRALCMLACHDHAQLVGIAPFYIQWKRKWPFSLREMRFLGTPDAGSDYLKVIAQDGRKKDVAQALYTYLHYGQGKRLWDQLVLTGIPAEDRFLLHFMAQIEADGKYAAVALDGFCPVLRLPESQEALYRMISPGWRKKVKQDIRVLNREQDVAHSVNHAESSVEPLADFFHLYEAKAGRSGKQLRAVLERVAAKYGHAPPLQLDLLSVNDQMVAGLLHLEYRDRLSMYLMAIDKSYNPKISLGNYLIGQAVSNAINAGYTDYDFLKGEEGYKFHWANDGNRTLRVQLWRRRPMALCSAYATIARNAAKLLIR